MAIRLADTARPNNHVDAEHLGTFPVAYAEDVWFEDGTRLSEKTFDGQSIQKEELPFASADEEGNIYQYIGATGTYTNGYFYKCVEQTPTGFGRYEWQELKFVENPVVYSETVPAIQDYETGSVVLYTGTDTPVYFKGHSYRLIKQIISGRWFKINGDNYFAIGNSIAEGDYLFEFPDASPYVVPTYIVTSVSGDTVTAQSVSDASTTISGEITNPTATGQSIAYWEDIGGGNAVGGIIDVKTLPTSDIKNTFYRTKESVVGKTSTIEVILTFGMSFDEKVAYLSQYFTVHPDQANNRIDIETYLDLYMTRTTWTRHYSVPENTLGLMYVDTETNDLYWDASDSGVSDTSTSTTSSPPLLFSSSHFPSAVYYAGDEINQTTERMATYEDIPKEFIGTQAEWDNLTADEKSQYTIVNITDDTNTNGKFIDITSQCTIVLGTAKVMKCGQIVVIHGYVSKVSGSNGFREIATGVPVPISNGTNNSAIGTALNTTIQGARIIDSTLRVYCSTASETNYSIMYLTDE